MRLTWTRCAFVGSWMACCACSSSAPSPGVTAGGSFNASAGMPSVAGSDGGADASGAGGAAGSVTLAGAGGAMAGSGGAAGTAGTAAEACAGPGAPVTYPRSAFTPDADTVAFYQLDDLDDSGPLGLSLTNNGGVTFTSAGLDWPESAKNGVARFQGTEQSLTRDGLSVGSEFTLDAHIFWRGFRNRTCGAPSQLIALTSGSAGISFGQACGVATGPRVRVNDTTDIVAPSAFEDLADDTWHWVRFAITGGKASFLVDGVALGNSAALSSLGTANWTLTLGRNFLGDIDEVRLVKKALAAPPVAPHVAARPSYRELKLGDAAVQLTAEVAQADATLMWSKVRGPGNVVFSDPTAKTTRASFCEPGKYVLQAVASQAGVTATDEVVVRVWPAEGRKQPYKVLFLGNSFSFYNGTVGYRFWEFSKAAGEAVGDSYAASPFVKMLTSPGQPFQFHWYEHNSNGECTNCIDHVLPAPPTVNLTDFTGKYAQDIIADGDWDVVVMHSYSTAASRDPTNFFRYGKKLDRLIKRSGARVVLYQTWAYPGVDNTTAEEATLLGNYAKLAQDTGAALSQVGQAFKDAHAELNGYVAWPNGVLFKDNKHPSSFGTYLAAAVHFGVIYGQSPVPLSLYPGSADISTPSIDSDPAKADKLRAIAARYAATTPLQSGQ